MALHFSTGPAADEHPRTLLGNFMEEAADQANTSKEYNMWVVHRSPTSSTNTEPSVTVQSLNPTSPPTPMSHGMWGGGGYPTPLTAAALTSSTPTQQRKHHDKAGKTADELLRTPEMLPVGLLDSPTPSPLPEEFIPPPAATPDRYTQQIMYRAAGILPPSPYLDTTPPGYGDGMYSVTGSSVMNAKAAPFIPQGMLRRPLEELRGHLVRLSKDQEGSRTVQRTLDAGLTETEVFMILEEIIPSAVELITDVFGNYVVQRMFDVFRPAQRRALLRAMRGHIPDLALQTYGCRVLQKALEVVDEEGKQFLSDELEGHVGRCVQDQNGNHVIQKCIECMPERIDFVTRAFRGSIPELATHAYGCRVLQRLLEFQATVVGEPILEEVIEHIDGLVVDQYGNYVVQYLIMNAHNDYRQRLIKTLVPKILDLSRHKYASNVAEKMIEKADTLSDVVDAVTLPAPGESCSVLVAMMRDQYANYVVQKLLDCSPASNQARLVEHIRPHVNTLRRYPYGKHIIARLEKMGVVFKAATPSPGTSPQVNRGEGNRHDRYNHQGDGGYNGGGGQGYLDYDEDASPSNYKSHSKHDYRNSGDRGTPHRHNNNNNDSYNNGNSGGGNSGGYNSGGRYNRQRYHH
eukprot:PhF_6_TR43133/c2_g1_i1/m.65987/K17943/PUM; pumilio RNA-binding family